MKDDVFKINKQKNSNKTIRMPEEIIMKLQELADKNNISFNQVVVQCCEFALNHLVDTDE
ncbi:MAG: hypothetical protein IJL87_02525 [Clostridia bacterium]|nr:hypothetical protein [Clostridia bacterium]